MRHYKNGMSERLVSITIICLFYLRRTVKLPKRILLILINLIIRIKLYLRINLIRISNQLFYIRGFEGTGSVGDCFAYMPDKPYMKYYDQFDYVKWFNLGMEDESRKK